VVPVTTQVRGVGPVGPGDRPVRAVPAGPRGVLERVFSTGVAHQRPGQPGHAEPASIRRGLLLRIPRRCVCLCAFWGSLAPAVIASHGVVIRPMVSLERFTNHKAPSGPAVMSYGVSTPGAV